MADFLQNQIKIDEFLPEATAKPGTYSQFGFQLDPQGGMLPSSSAAAAPYASQISMTAGEGLTSGDVVGPGVILEAGTQGAVGSLAFGDVGARTRIAQSIQFTPGAAVVGFKLSLRKVSSPTDTVTLALQADTAGAPSGTDLQTVSFAGSTLTSAFVTYEARFPTQAVAAATTFWLVFRRSGANDATNYYQSEGDNSNQYSGGTASSYNGTSWSNSANDLDFVCYAFENDGKVGKLYMPTRFLRDFFSGFAGSTVNDGDTVTVHTALSPSVFTGLTAGEIYYMSTSSSGALSITVPSAVTIYPTTYTNTMFIRPVLNALSSTQGTIMI